MAGKTELMGDKELAAILAKGGKESVQALATSLYTTGNLIMRLAKDQVPFRTGVLKSSGRVFEPQTIGSAVVVDLGFGGAAAAYALITHENARKAHFNNGKKAHYLSDPMMAGGSMLAGILAKKLGGIV